MRIEQVQKLFFFSMKGAHMKLEGKAIQHVKFGKGIVKEQKEQYITIIFSNGEKNSYFQKHS